METFQILGHEITFSTERVNYFQVTMMYRKTAGSARQKLEKQYDAFGNMKKVIEGLEEAAFQIFADVIQKSVEYIQQQKIYTIDFDGLFGKCGSYFDKYFLDAFEAVFAQYAEIIDDKNKAAEYRKMRKAGRARYSGYGYGISGAISASAKAGALNMATGIGHSLVNSIGNVGSSAASAVKQSSLYHNEKTRSSLLNGIYQASYGVCFQVMDIISRQSAIKFKGISENEASQARALSNNILKNGIPEQDIQNAIVQSLSINPENEKLIQYAVERYGDADKHLEQMGEFFGYDLKVVKQEAVHKLFGKIEEKEYGTETELLAEKEALLQKSAELGLDAAPYIAIYEAKWQKIDQALRTVEGIEYQTRDMARNVEKDIDAFQKKCAEFHWDDKDLLDEACRDAYEAEIKGAGYLEEAFVAQIRERLEKIWEPYIYRQDIVRRLSDPDTFFASLKEIVSETPVYETLRKKISFYDSAENIRNKAPISKEDANLMLLCIDRTLFGNGKKGTLFTTRKLMEYDKQESRQADLKEIADIRPENSGFTVRNAQGDALLTISSPGMLSDEDGKGFAALLHALAAGISRTDTDALEKKLLDISMARQAEREASDSGEKKGSIRDTFLNKISLGRPRNIGSSLASLGKSLVPGGSGESEPEMAEMQCPGCGGRILKGDKFCCQCGTKVR